MIERQYLRIVRAVQRLVAAAKDLADAERALNRRPRKRARRKTASPKAGETGRRQDAGEVRDG